MVVAVVVAVILAEVAAAAAETVKRLLKPPILCALAFAKACEFTACTLFIIES